MNIMNPILFKDFYKVSHVEQYPKGTTLVFSNFTPRKSLIPRCNYAVFFGLQYLMQKYLIDEFNQNFFQNPNAVKEYRQFMKETLGVDSEFKHIEALHKLGYLPLKIYSLPDGSKVPIGIPALVIHNTLPEFYWLPNMLETLLSCILWGASNSATVASMYRTLLDRYASETSDQGWFVDYQAHDFSFRGLFGVEAAMLSGAGHLQFFKGTDTIPGILMLNKYYGKPLSCGTSVPATEHSVMSAGGKDNELETYKRLITEVYPKGIISIVSDTWDLWHVLGDTLPKLKKDIMSRDGKVVIRPDSGDPVDILCGSVLSNKNDLPQTKGVIQVLWDLFGGTINSKGYKELDPHIGAIYGDSITLKRAEEICEKLKLKGFASTNIVFGIGSYTYQYNTRDTLGWAMKATYCEINGQGHSITKNPITDDGTKKSASGLLKVVLTTDNSLELIQNCTWQEFNSDFNQLKLKFRGGEIIDQKEPEDVSR